MGACCWGRGRWSSPARPRRRPGCSIGCRSAFPASRASLEAPAAPSRSTSSAPKNRAPRAGKPVALARHRAAAPIPLVDPTPTRRSNGARAPRRADRRRAAGAPPRWSSARSPRSCAACPPPSARPRSPSGGGSRRCRPPSARSRSPRSRADFLARHPEDGEALRAAAGGAQRCRRRWQAARRRAARHDAAPAGRRAHARPARRTPPAGQAMNGALTPSSARRDALADAASRAAAAEWRRDSAAGALSRQTAP